MQRDSRPVPLRVSTAMRKSFLRLEEKSRWLPRREPPTPQPVRNPEKTARKSGRARRPITRIVKDREEAPSKLEEIEGELADWLNSPS
jgi:hypothetical protein